MCFAVGGAGVSIDGISSSLLDLQRNTLFLHTYLKYKKISAVLLLKQLWEIK
jgi:hypothetical protein